MRTGLWGALISWAKESRRNHLACFLFLITQGQAENNCNLPGGATLGVALTTSDDIWCEGNRRGAFNQIDIFHSLRAWFSPFVLAFCRKHSCFGYVASLFQTQNFRALRMSRLPARLGTFRKLFSRYQGTLKSHSGTVCFLLAHGPRSVMTYRMLRTTHFKSKTLHYVVGCFSADLHFYYVWRFPLYPKGVERFRFDYAVFLLNKDIEQVRVVVDFIPLCLWTNFAFCLTHWPQLLNARGLGVSDLRNTLPNIHVLLENEPGQRGRRIERGHADKTEEKDSFEIISP